MNKGKIAAQVGLAVMGVSVMAKVTSFAVRLFVAFGTVFLAAFIATVRHGEKKGKSLTAF
jgi:hypothetical protein